MRSAIVENGIVVNVIDGSIEGSVECAESVSIGWDYDGVDFTPPALSLEAAKKRKNEELETAFNAACDAPVIYNSIVFQADKTARHNLTEANAFNSAGGTFPPGFTWRALDNTEVAFSGADIAALVVIIGDQKLAAKSILSTKKDAVIAAPTVEEVEAITWS